MSYSKPFPGQNERVFKDTFGKWPRLMRWLVLISLFPPMLTLFLVQQDYTSITALRDTVTWTLLSNSSLLLWGILLRIRARKYWYRNYHIGKTMLLAFVPIAVCGYLLIAEAVPKHMVTNNQPRTVQISIN
ncbi:hypothetical protein [Photobacterium aquae]|uniref:hypothetical protein n=1 Tax=Photobacterium aquae TaxID=1195763 RepID=UPI00069F70B4|nr:hypothetical protein [Photobacterium aquae]